MALLQNQLRTLGTVLFACVIFIALGMDGAHAKNTDQCGGYNQKPCRSILNPIGVCDAWHRLTGGQCKPCGGRGQRACPILKKGKPCRDGLEKQGQICDVKNCGGRNQAPCKNIVNPIGVCSAWHYRKDGRCIPCGGGNQPECPAIKKGPRCKTGLARSNGYCRFVSKCAPGEKRVNGRCTKTRLLTHKVKGRWGFTIRNKTITDRIVKQTNGYIIVRRTRKGNPRRYEKVGRNTYRNRKGHTYTFTSPTTAVWTNAKKTKSYTLRRLN